MNSKAPTRVARLTAWLAVVIAALLCALGFYWYDYSPELSHRFQIDIIDRVGGPMTFRFFLQPMMAAIFAIRDFRRAVRDGERFISIHTSRQALYAASRIFLLGVVIDAIYQLRVLSTFYPIEAVAITLMLAVVPYLAIRSIAAAFVRPL